MVLTIEKIKDYNLKTDENNFHADVYAQEVLNNSLKYNVNELNFEELVSNIKAIQGDYYMDEFDDYLTNIENDLLTYSENINNDIELISQSINNKLENIKQNNEQTVTEEGRF